MDLREIPQRDMTDEQFDLYRARLVAAGHYRWLGYESA
jgi:hypothetical protein